MKNNFRNISETCTKCAHRIERLSWDQHDFYCGLDGIVTKDLVKAWSNSFSFTEEEYLKIDEDIYTHRVYLDTVCDDFEAEGKNVLP